MGYQKKYENVYEYILESMNPDGFEEATAEEKLQNFVECFSVEYSDDWKKSQWPNVIVRVAEYLKGLPSSCSVAYTSYDIFLAGQDFGYISKDITTDHLPTIYADRQANLFINNWWKFIADRLSEMLEYYDIDFPKICLLF